MPRIFVSYSRADKEFVKRLEPRLRRKYRDGFWYDDEIRGGDIWWDETILPAIVEATVFVYLLSNDSIESVYCRAELTEAQRWAKYVLPVIVRPKTTIPADLKKDIGRIQYVDMSAGINDETIVDLIASIDNLLSKPAPPDRPLWDTPTPLPVAAGVPPVPAPGGQQPLVKRRVVPWMRVIGAIIIVLLVAGAFVFGVIVPALRNNASSTTPPAVNTPPGVPTSDLDLTVQAEIDAINTRAARDRAATATLWTLTPSITPTFTLTSPPTPDIGATAALLATQTQDVANTLASQIVLSWTPTFTPSFTPSITPTPLPTDTLTPEPLPLGMSSVNPVTSNNQWTPLIQTDAYGVEMVLVPAGCFMMGSTDEQIDYAVQLYGAGAERAWFTDEQPQHQICFDAPFWIDRYEVTNEQFNRLGGEAASPSYWTDDQRPRETITWFEARDFCKQKRGARLPTEAEWEYAARGPDGLIFPWGNEVVADNVVYWDNSGNETANVGSRPGGVSWVGALDMSGNVWEWVSSLYQGYPYGGEDEGGGSQDDNRPRVLRGGSWGFIDYDVRAAYRAWLVPPDVFNDLGYRCALSYN